MKRTYEIPLVSSLGYEKAIFNDSHRAFSEAEKMVLAIGLRSCLPSKPVDSASVKCSFEMLYRNLLGLGHSLTSEDRRIKMGVTKQSNEVTSNEVTEDRVTRTIFKGLKSYKSLLK